MSRFESGLREARSKQRNIYLLAALVLLLGAFGVAGVVAFGTGTAIQIAPDDAAAGATVRIVDGVGMAIGHRVYGLTGAQLVEVGADGFEAQRLTITAAHRGKNIAVALKELPGHLIVETKPPQERTRWQVDGTLTLGPGLDIVLQAGAYRLDMDNPYFTPETRNFNIGRGEEKRLLIDLQPVSGEIQISSLPEGASVRLDGTEVGTTPVTVKAPGGSHRIEVSRPDYVTADEVLEITRSAPSVARTYRLERSSASLRFLLRPEGGDLLLDGLKIDPRAPQAVAANVEHSVIYTKTGYFTETRKVTLRTGEIRSLPIDLKVELGALDIRSSPTAAVFINGRKMGDTPLSISLPAQAQAISLRRDGYRSIDKTITPSSKRRTVLDETLIGELAARLAEAPTAYENSAGQSLKLFIPSAFVMGAPRSEKDQRANEFLKPVTLTKPFYAAIHETTNEQFQKFRPNHPGTARLPVTLITWIDAALFCNWLSAREGLTPFYDLRGGALRSVNKTADGYRLLSEAEWEWLARRAAKSAQTLFPWGEDAVVPPMAGNIADESSKGITRFYVPDYTDGFAEVAPVGRFAAEPSGLFDLTGNVSEWVHDFYSLSPPAPNAAATDPLGPDFGDSHVVKGSSWRSGTRTTLRAAYRDGLINGRDDVGFRVGRYLYGGGAHALVR